MASLPELGIFSTHSLMLDSLGANIGRTALIKRMAILFDRLVFFPIGLGPVGTPNALFSRQHFLQGWVGQDARAAHDIDKLVLLDYEVIEDIDQFYKTLFSNDHDDLWTGESSQAFVDFCQAYVDDTYPETTLSERWELYKAHIGYMNSDYRLCQIVNRNFENCSALVTELHERAVLESKSSFPDLMKSVTTPPC